MKTRLLATLDQNSDVDAVQTIALRIGCRLEARLAVAEVIDDPRTKPEPVPIGGSSFKRRESEVAYEQAKQQLDARIAKLAEGCDAAGVEVDNSVFGPMGYDEVVERATPFDTILIARESDRGGHRRLRDLLERTSRPLISVHDSTSLGDGLLVAYDGSVQASRALMGLVASGLGRLGPATVLTVAGTTSEASNIADDAVSYLAGKDIEASTLALSGDPKVILPDTIERLTPLVLVMGAYGRNRIAELFFGSVTRKILDVSPVPVLLYG